MRVTSDDMSIAIWAVDLEQAVVFLLLVFCFVPCNSFCCDDLFQWMSLATC